MARNVKISCLCSNFTNFGGNETNAQKVETVKRHLTAKLDLVLPDRPDAIVLPEICDYPYNPDTDSLSPADRDAFLLERGERIFDFLSDIARNNAVNIAYCTERFIAPKVKINSLRFINRSGGVDGEYVKNFPTIPCMDIGGAPGVKAELIETDYGKVAGVICFDLNFEELRQAYKRLKPDLIVFSSFYHGDLVQPFWAFDCRAFFAGALIRPSTPSSIIAPNGRVLGESTNYTHYVTRTINLDSALLHLDGNAPKLRELKRKYGPAVEIDDNGRLGCVLLYNLSAAASVNDLIAEYELELFDDYLDRARARIAARKNETAALIDALP